MGFHLPKMCLSPEAAAGCWTVFCGWLISPEIFHSHLFANISRHVTGYGTRLVSLEMENEMLRAIIMAPPSSCHWLAVCWGVISPHTSPIFLCPEESWPGKRNLTLAFLASFSRNQNQSSGVVSNYVRCTVKRLWHLVPTRGSGNGQRCWVHQQNHQVQCVEGKAPGSLPFNAFVHPHFTCPKYCLQLTSPASIWRPAPLTPHPSRQLVCVNNYSNKSVIGPFWYETVWAPLQHSKPDKCNWASVVHKHHRLFPQQMTQLKPELAAFPPPLHPCRSRPSCNADMSCPSVPHLAAYSSGASTRTVCQFCKITIISRETLKS